MRKIRSKCGAAFAAGLLSLLFSVHAMAGDTLRHGSDVDRIKNWRVADDKTLVIDTYGNRTYEATFRHRCVGPRFAQTI